MLQRCSGSGSGRILSGLLWNATTFGRQVAQRYFADWHALAQENQRIWEAYYLWPAYEPWEGWQRWMAEHRTLVVTVQEVYEAQYGRRRAGRLPARQDVQERDIKPDITGA